MKTRAQSIDPFNLIIAILMIASGLIVAIGYLNLGGLFGGIGALIIIIKSLLEKGVLS